MALERNNTWSLVPLSPNRKAIWLKCALKVKENADGTIHKYKAKLVGKGFQQLARFDFAETFSPMVKPITIRAILTIALTNN